MSRSLVVADVGTGAVGVDVDGHADHVGGKVTVVVERVPHVVEDRASHGAQRHIALGVDQIDRMLPSRSSRKTPSVLVPSVSVTVSTPKASLRSTLISRKSSVSPTPPVAAVSAGGHRDVVAGDVDRRLVVGVENAYRREQRHVAGRRVDVADEHVADQLRRGDVAVGGEEDLLDAVFGRAAGPVDVGIDDEVDRRIGGRVGRHRGAVRRAVDRGRRVGARLAEEGASVLTWPMSMSSPARTSAKV